MDTELRQREHAADLERIREGHREWERREHAAREKRAGEDAERTRQAQERQQRLQEAENARQRVWSARLHVLDAQLAAIAGGISTANASALDALIAGDIDRAGDLQARMSGLLTLRDRVDADLAAHKRSG